MAEQTHKTSWTVEELETKFGTAEAKTRWTTTQVQVLLERIAELETKLTQLNKERTFILTLLDDGKISNESIRTAADALGIKLPKVVKKK